VTASLDKICYDELTWPEINEAVEARKVVLIPVGSTEQHGPHLPLDTDNFLARAVCLQAAARARREHPAAQPVGSGFRSQPRRRALSCPE